MKSCKEKAKEWNLSVRTVNDLCRKGKIEGAVKTAGVWEIPDSAQKPADGRISSGKYVKHKQNQNEAKKPLPVGISDYIRAQSEYYYVDKTLLIKDFLDQKPFVSLFTRPRRFGKTLNMDMLRVFLNVRMKIPANILLIKIYGAVARTIACIRENILSFFLLLKTLNLIRGKQHWIKSKVFYRKNTEDILNF